MPAKITVCGIPRSGSTLLMQVIRRLFPSADCIATHPAAPDWRDDGTPIIGSYRDPRDVAASLYRVHLSRAGIDAGTRNILAMNLRVAARYFDALNRLALPHALVLQYERFWNNSPYLFDCLADFFDVTITEATRASIWCDCDLAANRRRAAALPDFNAFDNDGIHGDHIHTGEPGSWMTVVPQNMHEQLLDAMLPYCERLGYCV